MALKKGNKDQARKKLQAKYKSKGLSVSVSYNDPPKVTEIRLELTPEEWVGCLNKEGEYLEACCGNISRVRDILFGVLREDGMIRVDELWEAAYLLRTHHDKANKVQQKIIDLWEAVKKDADRRVSCRTYDNGHLPDAVELMAQGCNLLAWDFGQKDRKQLFQKDVNWYWQFYKMFPALRTIYKSMQDDQVWQPKKGWALYERGQGILEFNFGLAIFETKQEVERIKKELESYHPTRFRREDKQEIPREFLIRPVELSIEKGLVFLDDDQGPEGEAAVQKREKVAFEDAE